MKSPKEGVRDFFLVYFEVQKHDPYKLGKICVSI
jgi:hypothetical protein